MQVKGFTNRDVVDDMQEDGGGWEVWLGREREWLGNEGTSVFHNVKKKVKGAGRRARFTYTKREGMTGWTVEAGVGCGSEGGMKWRGAGGAGRLSKVMRKEKAVRRGQSL